MSNLKRLNPHYSAFLYRAGQAVCCTAFGGLGRCQVTGMEHVPQSGAAIFAANHRAYIDPPLVGCFLRRPLFYFAKEELFDVPVLGWYIRAVNSFPVRRTEHDVSALKRSLSVLKQGECLTLFPEGGRRSDPAKQWQAKPGVAMLAHRAQVPVIPVGLVNTDRWLTGARLGLHYGRAIAPPSGDAPNYQAYADHVMTKIKELCA